MTTDRRAQIAVAAVLLSALCVACAGDNAWRQGDSVDVSSYPRDVQRAYRVFALRCSRCHTLARPLNARIDDPQHWIRYVRRMRRMPGSGIDHTNADLILKFLLYYHRPEEAELPASPATDESTTGAPVGAPHGRTP